MKFTCDGEDVNPQLDLVGLPTETVALALIVDDPDAPVGVWDHWVEYDIGAADGDFTIEEGTGPIGIQGVNSWNLPGYGGPCPPDGETHTYTFAVFILKDGLDLPPAVDSATVRAAMEGKVIATVEIEGTYGR